ncbi:MAG: hypothetical protein WD054_05325 [Gemmatimonadota bacterium]
MTARRALPLLACAVLLCGARGAARAQLPADADWRTLEAANFRVTYVAGLDDLARHALASAQRAHAALVVLVAEAPTGTIDIVLADNVDFTNGYASPFPSNRIVIYAKPPSDVLELQYIRDWVELVVTHELAHIFHLDVSGPFGRFARGIFGRAPLPWPVFTAIGSPSWSIEGLAVVMESTIAGYGRALGSYNEMIVRTALLEDEIDSIDELSSASPVWPGAARAYIYGSLFLDYLARRYGPDVAARIVGRTAVSLIPAPLWFGNVGRSAFGLTFRDAYDDWRAELAGRYDRLSRELTAQRLTIAQPLTHHGGDALYPRFSPDGRFIVYAANDRRTAPRTQVIDAATGVHAWSERRNDVAASDWLPDGRVLTSTIDYIDPFRVYGDLYIVSDGSEQRVTRAARLHDVDVARSGRAVAVETHGGTNRLVLLEPSTGDRRPLTGFEPGTLWSLPRFSPDGDRIAAGRWRSGGHYDTVVLDTIGGAPAVLDAGGGISAAPVWSPDGRWLLFWSDRTGIANLFAIDTARTTLRQVTNVLTGAFFPDISPDGRFIAFSTYHHNGFRIERIPFDPTQWREPMPDALLTMPDDRGVYDQPDTAARLTARAVTAAAGTDTLPQAAGAYRPLRHLRPYYWLPLLSIDDAGDDYAGLTTGGRDLVGRHGWYASALIAPSSGRTQGSIGYSYRGLPPLGAAGLHPSLSLSAARDWDPLIRPAEPGGLYVDEREDAAAAAVDLTIVRWRTRTGLVLAGELVRRSRYLGNTDSLILNDAADDLFGARAMAYFANTVLPPLAVSRQSGVTAQLAGRQRWDRDPAADLPASSSELITHNTAYLDLPLPGFARHVLATRISALLRQGGGADPASIGGASAPGLDADVDLDFVTSLGGASRLLPVRGFAEGVRFGTRAWSASAEYRFPIALVSRSFRPLPIFLDRVAGDLFLDAGDAWCDAATASRFPAGSCPRQPASAPLLSAGAELTTFLAAWGVPLPLRFGAAVPLHGRPADHRRLRFHVLIGPSF